MTPLTDWTQLILPPSIAHVIVPGMFHHLQQTNSPVLRRWILQWHYSKAKYKWTWIYAYICQNENSYCVLHSHLWGHHLAVIIIILPYGVIITQNMHTLKVPVYCHGSVYIYCTRLQRVYSIMQCIHLPMTLSEIYYLK
jgi:hypothetical protein